MKKIYIFFFSLCISYAFSEELTNESLYLESSFALTRAQEYLNSHFVKMPEYYFSIEKGLSLKRSRALLQQFSTQLMQNQTLSYQDRCARLLQCRAARLYSQQLAQWYTARVLSKHYTNDFLEFYVLYKHTIPIQIQKDMEQNAPTPAQRLYAKICNKQSSLKILKDTADFTNIILCSNFQTLSAKEIYWKIRCLSALEQLKWIKTNWKSRFLEYFLQHQKGDGSWNHSSSQSVWMTMALLLTLE